LTTIDRYVDDLDRELVGTRRAKADLVREARHHLEDARTSYQEAGHPPSDAADLAIRDFGTLNEVRAAYQTELSLAAAERTSLLVVATLLLQALIWTDGAPWVRADHPGADLAHALDLAVESFGGLCMLAAAVTALGCRVGTRWVGDGRLLALGGVLVARAAYAVIVPMSVALAAVTPPAPTPTSLAVELGWIALFLGVPMYAVARMAALTGRGVSAGTVSQQAGRGAARPR
jgi:hypothetical protein